MPVKQLELWDRTGKLLRKTTNKRISVAGIPNGIFLLGIKTKDRLFFTKVMVQH